MMNTRPPNKSGCLVYILSQVISQQLIEALDVQAKAIRVAVQVTQAARVLNDNNLGANLLRISQARIVQMSGNVRVGELESNISTRVGAFLPPEQFATSGGHDSRQQTARTFIARGNT
jgi:hypothetical protein